MKLNLKRLCLYLLGISLFSGACTPAIATKTPSMTGQPVETPPVSPGAQLLYRADPGRRGVYDVNALRVLGGIQWERSFDEDAYFPVYAGDTLYIGTASGRLLALEPESGQQRWSFAANGGPILAVAAANGTICFGAGDRGFYVVDAVTGELDWSFEADGSVWSSSPLIMNDLVYFGSDRGTVYALDRQTHQVSWTFPASGGVLWQLAGDSERVYVPTRNFLYALDAQTGSEIWSAITQNKWNAPAIDDGTVYVGNGSRQFMALDAATDEERWVFTAPMTQWSEWSAPVIAADRVYVGFSDKTVYALDRETGEQQWQFQAQDWATSDPILVDGVLYFGVGAHAGLADSSEDRLFYALDAATGQELWSFEGNGLVYSAATVGNGTVYFKTLENTLYALH
jgi:eukaryotic-like serine/threonine-protein kinase